ncbi:hypothetical protein KAR91_85145 [Candidatus Pacearchaeota archaeon]|nr:hypothetical protein [Candidatus Pacearchaeota archaeon]
MKLLKLRKKLSHIGLLLLERGYGDGFKVVDPGVKAPAVDVNFATLDEVEQWMKDQRHANRLTDKDDAQWDANYWAFVRGEWPVTCTDCEQTHPRKLWTENTWCCPSCGEGQI